MLIKFQAVHPNREGSNDIVPTLFVIEDIWKVEARQYTRLYLNNPGSENGKGWWCDVKEDFDQVMARINLAEKDR